MKNEGVDIDTKEQLIRKIVMIEWEMFQKVPNIGGPASCQQDWETFKINRAAQAAGWSEPMLESYLDDLSAAREQGRNLLTEKYGRMMESTSPEEYVQIKHLLPSLPREAPVLIDEIVKTILKWEEQLLEKYPHIVKRGRPIHSSEDCPGVTSVETYFRGELATYSLKTLKLYRDNIQQQETQNINGSEMTLEYMIKSYGYKSAEEANKSLGRARRS